MEKIKVYFNIGEHPIYSSLAKYPPPNIEIDNRPVAEKVSLLKVYSERKNLIRRATTKISCFFRHPRVFYFKTGADLIHTSRGIIPLNKVPWVMDIEHAKSFFDDHKVLYSERARRMVKKYLFSNYCKKIMPHCFIAGKSLLYHFGKNLKEKMEIVYPTIKLSKHKAKQDVELVKILFVANKFFEKGGLEVLHAFKLLKKKYDLSLIFKCRIPCVYRKEFQSNNITLVEQNLPYDKLFQEIYAKSNIFVVPSYTDTFGFSLLEAMSVGLPIVTTNVFAFPEIVENWKNGFLIDAKKYDWANNNGVMRTQWLLNPRSRIEMYPKGKLEIVKQLVEKISLLIENSSLRKRMGREGRKLIEKGKFSIKERNKKLKRIYYEAIKK